MRVAVVGAGGHGKVVADALIAQGAVELVGFLDDNPHVRTARICDYPVLGRIAQWTEHSLDGLAMGVGNNAQRRELFERLRNGGAATARVVHPRATIGSGVKLGQGVVMLANTVVNIDSTIGDNVILNTASSVDHDCEVGSHVHLAPGVHLAGNVRVGEGSFLGIGVVVLPGVTIGSWATIGAGAVVVRDVPDDVTIIGVPGKQK